MKRTRWTNVCLICALLAMSLGAGLVARAAPEGQTVAPAVIEPELQAVLESEGQANMFLVFEEQADLSAAYRMSWEQRGEYVYRTLLETAKRSQAQVQAYLDARGIPYQSYFIDNSIYISSASTTLANDLAALPGVVSERLEREYPVPKPEPEPNLPSINTVEWGVGKINADDVWARGYTGQGIVVANIDTGVRYTHAALVNQYRGNLGGGQYNHTYSWSDPTNTYPSAPGDNNGHGTHTMGTMVGSDGGSNQIGVAPGAKWIACKGCASSSCTDSALNACADWILAPGGDSSRRPNVVNNSWGGCAYDNWYRAKTNAWKASGIYPVFSAGNTSNCGYSSASCGTVGTPATYKEVTAVGATTSADAIASFSLWGPSQDPTAPNEIKPEISAPGSSIRSSYNSGNTSYSTMSGTSMAAPHYSGALALLYSACGSLIGDLAATEQLMKDYAVKLAYATGCGNEGPGNMPNNAFGYGRIDVLSAVDACSSGPGPTPTDTPTPTATPTPTPTPPPGSGDVIWLSLPANGALPNVGAVADEDIVALNTGSGVYSWVFDGSDVGISTDIDAFDLLPNGHILMSFDASTSVSGVGTVTYADIVEFSPTQLGATTSGTFSMRFDGSDVGLSSYGEDIDALFWRSDGSILVSIRNSFSVTGVSGQDEDLARFVATSWGATTAGSWSLYFDGSDVGLSESSSEDVDGLWVDEAVSANPDLYFSTYGNFSVSGLSGVNEDIFVFHPTSLGSTTAGSYGPGLYFDGSGYGLGSYDIDAFDIQR